MPVFSKLNLYNICVLFLRLVEELKLNNPDFPEVTSGIYVHEVVPNSPSQRYVIDPKSVAGVSLQSCLDIENTFSVPFIYIVVFRFEVQLVVDDFEHCFQKKNCDKIGTFITGSL